LSAFQSLHLSLSRQISYLSILLLLMLLPPLPLTPHKLVCADRSCCLIHRSFNVNR
jgi:hypothetical protein